MLKLNCDLGEGFGVYRIGDDAKIMPYVDMANLACGFHASDPLHMLESVRLAKRYGVRIGAHPGYPDLQGFGRRVMHCTPDEIAAMMLYQIGALQAICRAEGVAMTYVKPHGALYNEMMKDLLLFEAIVKSIADFDASLSLVILSLPDTAAYERIAQKHGIGLIYELFADRAYTQEGYLVSRSREGAVIEEKEKVLARTAHLLKYGEMESITGKMLKLKADTLCVHGDTPSARELVIYLRELLDAHRAS